MANGPSVWLSGPLSVTLHAIGRESALRLLCTTAIRNRQHFQIEGGALSGGLLLGALLLCVSINSHSSAWKSLLLGIVIGAGMGAIGGCLMVCQAIDSESETSTLEEKCK